MTGTRQFTYTLMATFVIIFLILSSFAGGSVAVSYATASASEFEYSYVLDDLEGAVINGKQFDISDYGYSLTREAELLSVVEYCYSYSEANSSNYGLYVYFYNPRRVNIDTGNARNKIKLGVKYGLESTGEIKVEEYEKFDLQFCSKSADNYRDLIYKFKVIDHTSADGKTVGERVNKYARRYDISEIEIVTYGDSNATAYTVGGTYTFTGFAKGYGADPNVESSLACGYDGLEVIELDIAGKKDGVDKRTFWRSDSYSSLGEGHQGQINSVYFAIDNTIFEQYGEKLQKIKAEWYEIRTAPVLVISDRSIYNTINQYIGETDKSDCQYTVFTDITSYVSLAAVNHQIFNGWNFRDYGTHGIHSYYSNGYENGIHGSLPFLSLLYYTGGQDVSDYTRSPEELKEAILSYDQSFNFGTYEVNGRIISQDVLAPVDEGHTIGYNIYTFDADNTDDYYNLKGYDNTSNLTLWQKLRGDEYAGQTILNDVPPIQVVKDSDLKGNTANKLKINADDVDTFTKFYNDSVEQEKTVIVFHYLMSDYYAHSATVKNITTGKEYDNIAEYRQGTQIFDFDILELTFNKSGELTTLPVASSPVDHFTPYTPSIEPEDNPDFWKIILAVIALIIIVSIVLTVISSLSGMLKSNKNT